MKYSRYLAIAASVVVVLALALPLLAKRSEKAAKAETAETAETTAKPVPAAETAKDADVVAYLAGEPITRAALYEAIASQMEYDVLERALDNLLLQKMLEKEAESRGMTIQQLAEAETDGKVPQPTKEAADEYYEQNKARFGNRTREEADADIARMLRAPQLAQRRSDFVRELKEKYDAKILLDPPRQDVPVPAGEPSLGPADAPVTMVMFADFQCGYCKRANGTVQQLRNEFGDRLHFVYRDYPLPSHTRAHPASEAARCAGDQGKYWEYHDNLMTVGGDLSDEDLRKRAQSLDLDLAAFGSCLETARHDAAINAGFQDGQALGVSGTPTFFINGRKVVGAKPFEEFKSIIQDEIARAEQKDTTTATK